MRQYSPNQRKFDASPLPRGASISRLDCRMSLDDSGDRWTQENTGNIFKG